MNDLDRDILEAIAGSPVPIGATSLHLMLRDRHDVSQAWIGKKLKEFDYRRLTQKCGFKGRILTDKGREELVRLTHYATQLQENDAFLKSLSLASGERLIDVLVARRALEREIAYIAAQNRTDEDLRAIKATLDDQDVAVRAGGSGAQEDVEFHDLVARASRNGVLFYALRVVRHASQFTPVVARIRRYVGGHLGEEHRRIYDCLRKGDAPAASKAMEKHISRLIEDVRRYLAKHPDG